MQENMYAPYGSALWDYAQIAEPFDHEGDHLEGIFFLDHLDKDAKLYIAMTDENGEEKLVPLARPMPG
jgi:hypothetical protein